jgi:hypothetical protein
MGTVLEMLTRGIPVPNANNRRARSKFAEMHLKWIIGDLKERRAEAT